MKSVLTLIQTVFKAVVIGVAIWQVVVGLLPLIAGSAYQSVEGIGEIGWSAVMKIMNLGLLLFIVIGPIDFGLQKWLFLKDQRMSKDEVKREYKDAEGKPMMKGQRKQLTYEIANGDPAQAVGSANAVVVNPTHYAVAIRYVPGETALPLIVAKGIDEQALNIRRHAETLGVPIFANPPLARALHKVPIDNTIPEELFEPVAAILRWVDAIGSRQRLQ
jgi:type III secretion protein U